MQCLRKWKVLVLYSLLQQENSENIQKNHHLKRKKKKKANTGETVSGMGFQELVMDDN